MLPQSLLQWLETELPTYVKNKYSPKSAWKNRPFSEADVHFFSKGLKELSHDLTTGRGGFDSQIKSNKSARFAYFTQGRYRSSYLLYFLPLQLAKFWHLFEKHSAQLKLGIKPLKKLKILDLGSGPGTASFAFLFWLKEKNLLSTLTSIEFEWWDQNPNILADGVNLFTPFKEHYPQLQLKTQYNNWQNYKFFENHEPDLILIGHVLNENFRTLDNKKDDQKLTEFILKSKTLGVLMLEPAFKTMAQKLSNFRNRLLKEYPQLHLIGPCLHSGRCPLSGGRDWCHFSEPVRIESSWFQKFSRSLGSERDWLKFTYLWWANQSQNKENFNPTHQKLVLTDPMKNLKNGHYEILLCQPEAPLRYKIKPYELKNFYRGKVITVAKEDQPSSLMSRLPKRRQVDS